MTAVPKPAPRERKRPKWLPRSTKPIARLWLNRGTKPVPPFNAVRRARRLKVYRARLARADWHVLRRQAWERDQGLCQCPVCIEGRRNGEAFAFVPIDVWFDQRGRIRGVSVHHTSYAKFGAESLDHLLSMWPKHHEAVEAMGGKRARFLNGTQWVRGTET